MTSYDERELLLSAVRGFLSIIELRRPLLTSRTDAGPRQYAAAALVRGCDLVDGGAVLLSAGRSEGVGILARSAWECWLVGSFLAFGGDAALFQLEAEQQRQERNLAERNSVDAQEILARRWEELQMAERTRRTAVGLADADDQAVQFDRLPLERIAAEVGSLVKDATGETANVSAAYDIFYRSHSAFDSHGLRALDRYIELADDGVLSLRQPIPWVAPHRSLALATMYLSLLAGWLFERFGIGRGDLDEIQALLLERTAE